MARRDEGAYWAYVTEELSGSAGSHADPLAFDAVHAGCIAKQQNSAGKRRILRGSNAAGLSPRAPRTRRHFSLPASAGSSDASTAARDATNGRRVHQTCRRFGAGNGVMGVRSRVLSIPSAEIGSHRSIRRVSAIVQSTAQPVFRRREPHRRRKGHALRQRPSRSRRSIQSPKRRHSVRIAASPTFSATNGPCRRFR